jgi:hypothetical protein
MESIIEQHDLINRYIIRMIHLMNQMDISKQLNPSEIRELIMTDDYKNRFPVQTNELRYVLNEINANYYTLNDRLNPEQ